MKRFLGIILSVTLIFSLCVGCTVTPPTAEELDSPTAKEVADGMNLGINLGNTFESSFVDDKTGWVGIAGKNTPESYETMWGAVPTTRECIEGMKEAGFDTVRIPVYWGNMMENDGKWRVNKNYLARVREVVDYAMDADLYVVVNMHHFDEFVVRRYEAEEAAEIFRTVWTQVAKEFKKYDYRLVFEGYNENMGGGRLDENGEVQDRSLEDAYELTNLCNQAFVDAVRATGGKNSQRVLIASGYWTNVDKTTAPEFVMPTDTVPDRLMVSVHYLDNNMYWSKNIGNQKWLDYIDDQCDKLDETFTSKGIPVFVGEVTGQYPIENIAEDAIYKDSADCFEMLTEITLERGYVAVIWTTANDLYHREICKVLDKDMDEAIRYISEKFR